MNLNYRPACLHLPQPYRRQDFFADLGSGLTVGVIALPLAIGFGIASGATPAQGLWTAIVGGLLISLLGGSRFQIGGPTGAFVPVLAGVVAVHGYSGLAIATVLAGILLVLAGVFGLGELLRYIPYPVVAGFTTGIAVIIFLGQMPDFLGLSIVKPPEAPELVWALIEHASAVQWQAVAVGALGLAIVLLFPRLTRRVPAAIVAVLFTTYLAWLLQWPVATIGSKFGGLPPGLPGWHFPEITLESVRNLAGPAFTRTASVSPSSSIPPLPPTAKPPS